MKIIDLSGEWRFAMSEKKDISVIYPEKTGDTIVLPSTTAQAGKGEYNTERETGYLTENYPFEGYAWFSRKINTSEYEGELAGLFLERTRITTVYVNGEAIEGVNEDSLCAPHYYELTPYMDSEAFELTICVANTGYKTKGGHMTSPDTQTNWNGITGRIELDISENERLSSVKVTTLDDKGNIGIDMVFEAAEDTRDSFPIDYEVYEICLKDGKVAENRFGSFVGGNVMAGGEAGFNHQILKLEGAKYWDEYSPVLYRLEVLGKTGEKYGETVFGLRLLSRDERRLYVNGKPVFLRGKHDGCLFPMTGACPTDLDSWLKVMGTAKKYGINHYRYHTRCPPEAAFTAADLLGIYVEPELPFWGTIAAPGEEGYNEAEQEYLITEGVRILDAFGNHPSFCFMSLGNELWGSSKRMAQIIRTLRKHDDRHLFTQGSNNFQFVPCVLEEDDFFVGVRLAPGQLIRGSYAMCDAPLGFVQTEKPGTTYSYDDVFLPYLSDTVGRAAKAGEEIEIQYGTGTKKVKATDDKSFRLNRPVVNHEIGQYATFPDFKEIKKYTGVLRAENLAVFKERMEKAGLIDYAPDYFRASGKLAIQCYKLELEAAHRSRFLSGYQILDIQDFSGQGTSLVGILDAFMDNKGLITDSEWRQFCNDVVVMAEIEDFVLEGGKTFDTKFLVSCYRPSIIEADEKITVKYRVYEQHRVAIGFDSGEDILKCSGSFEAGIDGYGVTEIGNLSLLVPDNIMPVKWKLELEIPGINTNSYELIIMPSGNDEYLLPEGLELAEGCQEALRLAKAGKKCICFAEDAKSYIDGFYCTDFWNYPMFKGISEWLKRETPVGTYGLLIDDEHPALSLFPSERYETPRWYEILTHARLSILPQNINPIVRMMDNFERNYNLGLLWECKLEGTPVLVCAQSLKKLTQTPEGNQFLKSICFYAATDEFAPVAGLDEKTWKELM